MSYVRRAMLYERRAMLYQRGAMLYECRALFILYDSSTELMNEFFWPILAFIPLKNVYLQKNRQLRG